MAMYRLATLPLIKLVNDNSLTQKLYADDWNAVGSLKSLRTVFENIIKQKIILDIIILEMPAHCKRLKIQ